MSTRSRHVDILESEISGKTNRVFHSISWDSVNKQYVVGLRVYYGPKYPFVQTIYIDFETISLLFKRLPEVISLLNKFNNYKIKLVKNYFAALRLSEIALTLQDCDNWGACEFDLSTP